MADTHAKLKTPDEIFHESEDMKTFMANAETAIKEGKREVLLSAEIPLDLQKRIIKYFEDSGWDAVIDGANPNMKVTFSEKKSLLQKAWDLLKKDDF